MVIFNTVSKAREALSDYNLSGFTQYYRVVRYIGLALLVLSGAAFFFSSGGANHLTSDHIARVNIGQVSNYQVDWLYALDTALRNSRAKGVVLVIDQAISSGSDLYEIEQAISHIRQSKTLPGVDGPDSVRPIVSFVYGYALGGSYVLASQTDYIVAQRTATLGGLSISVSSFDPKPLLSRIGVDIVTKGFGDLKVMPEKKDKNYQAYMKHRNGVYESLYRWMLATVKDNRSLSKSDMARVAQGEWYLGERALKYGLCDDTGDLTLTVDKMVKAHPHLDGLSIVDYGQIVSGESAVFTPVPALRSYLQMMNRWLFKGFVSQINQFVREEFLRLNRYVMHL